MAARSTAAIALVVRTVPASIHRPVCLSPPAVRVGAGAPVRQILRDGGLEG